MNDYIQISFNRGCIYVRIHGYEIQFDRPEKFTLTSIQHLRWYKVYHASHIRSDQPQRLRCILSNREYLIGTHNFGASQQWVSRIYVDYKWP